MFDSIRKHKMHFPRLSSGLQQITEAKKPKKCKLAVGVDVADSALSLVKLLKYPSLDGL